MQRFSDALSASTLEYRRESVPGQIKRGKQLVLLGGGCQCRNA
jgi:hypothetical protein